MNSRVPSAAPPDVRRALTVLRQPPTSAQVVLDPVIPTNGEGAPLAGWHGVHRLTQTPFVTRLATAYSAGLDTPHLAVGGACGLQHYAGRFVLATIGAWVQTGHLLDLAHDLWQVRLDADGHTTGVAPPVVGSRPVADPEDAAHAVVGEHLGPIVAATRAAARITERVAHGCIAASCSGAFAALHRRTPPERQGELTRIARSFMAAPAWRATRPLVDLLEVEVPTGVALVHERHVCCLIRLGRDHGACGTCPDIDPLERRRRTTTHAATAPRGTDLHLGVTHVA